MQKRQRRTLHNDQRINPRGRYKIVNIYSFNIGAPQHTRQMFSSVQFSRSVVSNSLRPREPQHTRPPCPSPTPRVYPNSCPLSQWCHPTISSSDIPCSSCLQVFPASRSFQTSQLFTSGGQSIGVSDSTSVLPMIIQDWFPLGWTGWIRMIQWFPRLSSI